MLICYLNWLIFGMCTLPDNCPFGWQQSNLLKSESICDGVMYHMIFYLKIHHTKFV